MLFGIGRLAERNGKTAKAIEAYQAILSGHPNHAPAMHRIGVIKARQGLIEEGVAWLQKASQTEAPTAELIGDIGYVHYLAGDLPAAKENLENGLRKKPNDERMTNNLAIVTGSLQDYNKSVNLFRQHGTEAEALAAIAYIQAQGGHIAAAKKNYLKSLDLDSKLEIAASGLMELDRNVSSESFQQQPVNEIEMPSPVQLAAYHPENTQQQSSELKATIESEPLNEASRIPSSRRDHPAADKVVLLFPSDTEPMGAESMEAEPLPVEAIDSNTKPDDEPQVKARLRGPMRSIVGENTVYKVFVDNEGTVSTSNIEVELILDSSMEIVSVSHEAWHNADNNSVTWTLNEMAAGATEEIDFEAVSEIAGDKKQRLTIKVDGQPVGELTLDTKVE